MENAYCIFTCDLYITKYSLIFFFLKRQHLIKVNSLKNCQKNLYCCISFKAGIKK